MSMPEPVPAQRIPDRSFKALNDRLVGDTVHPKHPECEDARRVWNHLIDRRPAVVVRCATDADVATAIEFAREHAVPLTVKGGGHSVAGHSMVDDGVVIDLGRMRHVTVDAEAGRVRVGGGCLLSDVDRATQVHGLATPFGVMSQTGVAGLALGGGMGWLTRKYGLTCDNLLSARVVLADGSVVHASATDNPDLYWGLRGAGANFGVVTEFEFATHVVGPTVAVGTALYRLDQAAEALAGHDRAMREAPDDLKVMLYLRLASAEPGVPDDLMGRPVLMMVSLWIGDAEEAPGINEELWGGASSVHTDIGTTSFVELQSCNDEILGPGACNYTKGGYLGSLTADCVETLIGSADRLRSPLSVVEISYQHGAQDRFDDADAAFADRHADHLINVLSRWHPDDEAQPHIDWARETFDATSRWHSGGVYANFMAADDDNRVKDAYRGGKYERLAVIKGNYDPDNVFRSNPNVQPARSAR
jgi:FAD/FMN-containing dehydrogenase